IGSTVSEPFYGRISAIARTNPGDLRPFIARSFWYLSAAAMIVMVPIVLFGPTLFSFAFGEEWRQAGVLAAITVPAAVLNLAALPISRTFALTSRPLLRYAFSAVNAIGTIAVCVVGSQLTLSM